MNFARQDLRGRREREGREARAEESDADGITLLVRDEIARAADDEIIPCRASISVCA